MTPQFYDGPPAPWLAMSGGPASTGGWFTTTLRRQLSRHLVSPLDLIPGRSHATWQGRALIGGFWLVEPSAVFVLATVQPQSE